MLLLTPFILFVVFGSMFFASGGKTEYPEGVKPLIAFGAMSIVLLTLSQLIGNQFGFDRNGFRV